MEKIFVLSFLVVFFYVACKVFEMKIIEKEWKPLKVIVRDAVIVLICTSFAGFIVFNIDGTINDFFNIITQQKVLDIDASPIFTGEPGF